ncbi:MAP7 domain containing 2 [Phyllostomus discolor]|uniref:MAP7 domain containing 2 n=1 Tax=Phyllostomus discolor TaxID=89673 RepID=A0A834DUV8_9CHIR|nr:MAP7 domain containing 2 [Phyllostomus discolor]
MYVRGIACTLFVKPQAMDGNLKSDERQRQAKERREEKQKSMAAREQQFLEKQRRAALQYEKQVMERWRKLEERRCRENEKRAAVEEKREQKLQERKERMEAILRRSLERTQQLDMSKRYWSGVPSQVLAPGGRDARDSLSASATHLSKQMESSMSKRPSSSTVTKSYSPQRAHRMPISSMVILPIARLLAPTQSRSTSPFMFGVQCTKAVLHTGPRICAAKPLQYLYKSSPTWIMDKETTLPSVAGDSGKAAPVKADSSKMEKIKWDSLTSISFSNGSTGSLAKIGDSPKGNAKRSSSPVTTRTSAKLHPKSLLKLPEPEPIVKYRLSAFSGDEVPKMKEQSNKDREGSLAQRSGSLLRDKAPEKNIVDEHVTEKRGSAGGKAEGNTGKPTADITNAEETSKILATKRRRARLQKELKEPEKMEMIQQDRL